MSTIETREQVEAWLKLAEAATPGPWKRHSGYNQANVITSPSEPYPDLVISHLHYQGDADDFAFIAAARDAVPRLARSHLALQADYAGFGEKYQSLLAAWVAVTAKLAAATAREAKMREALEPASDALRIAHRQINSYGDGYARDEVISYLTLIEDARTVIDAALAPAPEADDHSILEDCVHEHGKPIARCEIVGCDRAVPHEHVCGVAAVEVKP